MAGNDETPWGVHPVHRLEGTHSLIPEEKRQALAAVTGLAYVLWDVAMRKGN